MGRQAWFLVVTGAKGTESSEPPQRATSNTGDSCFQAHPFPLHKPEPILIPSKKIAGEAWDQRKHHHVTLVWTRGTSQAWPLRGGCACHGDPWLPRNLALPPTFYDSPLCSLHMLQSHPPFLVPKHATSSLYPGLSSQPFPLPGCFSSSCS